MRDEAGRRRVERLKASPRLKGEAWEYYEDFLEGKAIKTQYNYIRFFVWFLDWLGIDAEGLYKQYLEMVGDDDSRKRKRMSRLVVNFLNWLMETKGLKSGSAEVALAAIKGFFNANELQLKVTWKIPDDGEEITSISQGQQRKCLNATGSYKLKAFILFARDSGLRTGDITNLPIRVVRAVLDDLSIKYHTFECRVKKTGKMAYPVIGPECIEALRTWMAYRVNTLGISAEDGDPLFCAEKNTKGYTDNLGRYVGATVKGDWLNESTMGTTFGHLVEKAGLKPLPGETKLPSIHSFRKYHQTTLEYAGILTGWVNKMTGRKGEGTGGTYRKPNSEQLIEIYKKGYAALSGIEEDQHEKIEKLTHEYGLSQLELADTRAERDKYRADYELRTRLQHLIDRARIDGWSEDRIKKLEEILESTETFEDGVSEFHKQEREIELEEEKSENWDFKIVNEEAEVINYLKDGWEIFQELNDGRCILRRQSCKYLKEEDLGMLNESNFAQLVELNAMELYPSCSSMTSPNVSNSKVKI